MLKQLLENNKFINEFMKNPFQIESYNQSLKPFRSKQKSKLDTSRRSSGPLNANPSSLAGATSLAGGHVVKNRYGPSEKSFIDSKFFNHFIKTRYIWYKCNGSTS